MRKKTGKHGEALAVAHLENKGYRIIEQNWHCQRGEIDIVAKDDETWVFCEVKTRRSRSTQAAMVNMTPQKQEKMIVAAQIYVAEHNLDKADWRIDAIAVAIRQGQPPLLDHVEDVLDW